MEKEILLDYTPKINHNNLKLNKFLNTHNFCIQSLSFFIFLAQKRIETFK